MPRRGYDTGTTFYGPLRSRFRADGATPTEERSDYLLHYNPRVVCDSLWEFSGAATGYLAGDGGLLVSRTTNTPTGISQVANTANGELKMALAATNEVEYCGVDFTDELTIPASRAVYFEAYIKTPALALTSTQDIVIGLGTAYAAIVDGTSLASVSKFIRFRLRGSNSVLIEAKDGTTTNALQVPVRGALTLAASTYYLFTIDGHTPGVFRFWVDGIDLGTLTQSAFAATDLMQPYIGVAKTTAGTGIPILTMDFLRIAWSRL